MVPPSASTSPTARRPGRPDSARPRHRTPSLDVEHRVVEAALRILAADGAEALTVRRLAAEADVAPMTIYNRFGDMHGVFDAVLTHGFTTFARALTPRPDADDPIVGLHDMGRRYRSFALDNPDLYSFLFLRELHDVEPSEEATLAASMAFDTLLSMVRRAIDSARFRPGDPSVVAQSIWATCHGAVTLELLGLCEFADPEETYESLLVTLLRGSVRDPDALGD